MDTFSVPWLSKVILPLSIFLVTLIFGYILRKVLFRYLYLHAKRTESQFDDIVVNAIRFPSLIWVIMLGLYLALQASVLPERLVIIAQKVLIVSGIFSVTLVLANIVSESINAYSKKVEAFLPMSSLTQNLSKIVIFIVGFLLILSSLNISITPILTTLGIGGLAVALALQDTLSNLFAGLYIIISKNIKVGDYIKLESGEEGYVFDISWHTTKIKELANNIVLIPNSKLARIVTTNYHTPSKEISVLVNVGVHYNSDLEKVEKVTCEVAREVMKEVDGGVPSFEPFIRYHTFGDFSINFTVVLKASEFVKQYLIKHEFIKRLHKRYAKENIIIPYPIRAINYQQEKSN